jgi:DNA invertase Pin-like site-specific DNA recombinase
VVVAHELDRLGRSSADLAGFVENLREKGVDIDLVNQPIGTVGEDDWMAEMMLNMMMGEVETGVGIAGAECTISNE